MTPKSPARWVAAGCCAAVGLLVSALPLQRMLARAAPPGERRQAELTRRLSAAASATFEQDMALLRDLKAIGDDRDARRLTELLAYSPRTSRRDLDQLVAVTFRGLSVWNAALPSWQRRLLDSWIDRTGRRALPGPWRLLSDRHPVRLVLRWRGAPGSGVLVSGDWDERGELDDVEGWRPVRMKAQAPGVWTAQVSLEASRFPNLYHAVAKEGSSADAPVLGTAAFDVAAGEGGPTVALESTEPSFEKRAAQARAPQRRLSHVSVLCVDGANWHVLRALAESGVMPNLRRLLAHGAYGVLTSPKPLASPRNIYSALSGVAPYRTGVTATHFELDWGRRALPLWSIASRAGRDSLVVGFLGAFPVAPIRGELVPDVFFAARLSASAQARRSALSASTVRFAEGQEVSRLKLSAVLAFASLASRFAALTWPAALRSRMDALPLARIDDKFPGPSALANALDSMAAAALEDLEQRRPHDLVCAYFRGVDGLCHKSEFWSAFEPQSIGTKDRRILSSLDWSRSDAALMLSPFQRLDALLGRLAATSDYLLVFSDHGFVPDSHPELGLDPQKLWRAFDPAGPQPQGSVAGSRWTFKLPDASRVDPRRFASFLGGIFYEPSHQPMFADVAADAQGAQISFTQRPTGAVPIDGLTIAGHAAHVLTLFDVSKPNGGIHAPAGVILITGPGIRAAPLEKPVYTPDVAPTALYLLGVPAARDMDGRLITEAIQPEFLKTHPLRFVQSYGRGPGPLVQLWRAVR